MTKQRVISIIMPVFNEAKTVMDSITRVRLARVPRMKKQLVIVDDGSTDGTTAVLKKLTKKDRTLRVIFLAKNRGKGAAIREGIKYISGDYTVIQDADLEYDPQDYNILLEPMLRGNADVVYGSRFQGTHRSFLFWNFVANKMLTFVTNVLYNTLLTDMETCYKLFKTPLLKKLNLRSSRFEIEPELTAKVLKNRYKIYEVPIHFYGRSYDEGKKIKAIDGFIAMWTLFKYRFVD
jgi:glycosyltransferase involved in cell wall biosynthesis